ncbi:hypothetical protein [Planctopirus limnophila]|uniref:hypothetical protein n=1 Tax=Planctopirus limnophila TaxID=120 RepID=UPI0011D06214|nr:hypothetical protein [Planctopirus limnophila]
MHHYAAELHQLGAIAQPNPTNVRNDNMKGRLNNQTTIAHLKLTLLTHVMSGAISGSCKQEVINWSPFDAVKTALRSRLLQSLSNSGFPIGVRQRFWYS